MTRYGMLVDVTKCNGCYNCFLVCKDEHCGISHPPYAAAQPMTGHTWMRILEKERGRYPKVKVDYIAIPCMHCSDPACVAASPTGAVYLRDDGIVLIDPEKARGDKDVLSRCPYRVIYWNEAEQVAQKCTLCAHLLDQGWNEPRCVEACPTGALLFGDLDDPGSALSNALASTPTEVLHSEYGLGEKVLYVGLPKRFIAGAVVFGDTDECAVGVTVALEGGQGKKTTQTDSFGDFEFEDLPADTVFKVVISAPRYEDREIEARTSTDVYLGDIALKRTG